MGKIDVLNRKIFIQQLLDVVETLSNTKANLSFSIDGAWGVGKTFVLEEFERQLSNIQSPVSAENKYLIFHYNAWQYDYYDEPLVALISALVESIDENNHLLSQKTRSIIRSALKKIGSTIFSAANVALKTTIGVDLKPIMDAGKEIADKAQLEVIERKKYDKFFALNNSLKVLKFKLRELSEKYTLVLVVDELDRCIPEYAIKVLERLHHISNGISNFITLIAIDRSRLQNSIQQVFGAESDKYLEKFTQFEFKLDVGTLTGDFFEKYSEYTSLFDNPNTAEINEFLLQIFTDINVRTQEQILAKVKIIHMLLIDKLKNKTNQYVMCMEIFYAVMFDYYQAQYSGAFIRGEGILDFFNIGAKKLPRTVYDFFNTKTEKLLQNSVEVVIASGHYRKIVTGMSLYKTLLLTSEALRYDYYAKTEIMEYTCERSDVELYNTFVDDMKQFNNLYSLIK